MSKNIVSVDQRFAALGAHIDWDSLTTEQVQVGIQEAHTFVGQEATRFIANGFRVISDSFRETGELTLQIPALPRPTLAELQAKFDWVKRIERDTSPIEAVTLKLATVLREGEKSVNGAEYERRLTPKLDLVLGYQQAVWLEEHQDEFSEFMALLGKIYIDFSGLVVVHADGGRGVPYFDQDGERWELYWHWLRGGFRSGGRVAVSGK